MTTRLPWRCAALLSLLLLACGGAVGESATSSPDAGSGAATDGGVGTGDDTSPADAATPDAKRSPSTGVVWVHAEASSFDPRACKDPVSSDFIGLGNYLSAQAQHAGLTDATISAGGGVCAFGASPTTMAETYVFKGTVAAAQALASTPPAPFQGTYVTVPLAVKAALSVKFELFVSDGGATHAFDDVWVHDGLDFDGEATFASDICNKKASFDAAIVTSPAGAAVKAWLAGRSADAGYRLGYDATFTFDDGTTTKIANAHEAAGGPYLALCPNLVASPGP